MMKKWLVTGTLLIMAALVAGCASTSTSWGHCNIQQDSRHKTEGTVCTDRYQYKFGETVHIRFTATNISGERLVLEPREGGPAMDICVTYKGIEMWWSEGQELGPEWMRLELEPGQSRTIEWEVVLPERYFYGVSGCWPDTAGFVIHAGVRIDYEAPKPG